MKIKMILRRVSCKKNRKIKWKQTGCQNKGGKRRGGLVMKKVEKK